MSATITPSTVLADPITCDEVAAQPDEAAETINELARDLARYRKALAMWRQAAGRLQAAQRDAAAGLIDSDDLANALTHYQDTWNALEALAKADFG